MENDRGRAVESSIFRSEADIMHNWRESRRPVASVICATYNHEEFIRDAIEGFLMQETDFPFEIIIHDDASTDNTAVVVNEYAQKYPMLIKPVIQIQNQYSKGHKITRLALPYASGEFIALCEGDDYWIDRCKLQKQVNVLQSQLNVGLVYSNFADLKRKNNQWVIDWSSAKSRFPKRDHLRGEIFGQLPDGRIRTLTILVRKKILQGVFERDIPFEKYFFGDTFIYFHAAAVSLVERIEDVAAVYRHNPYSVTRGTAISRLNFLLNMKMFYDNLPSYFPEHTCSANVYIKEFDLNIARAAFIANAREDFRSAIERLNNSFVKLPFSLRFAIVLESLPFFKTLILKRRSWLKSIVHQLK